MGARALEFILLPGETLYIPAYWIHYISSLSPSIQCNARLIETPAARKPRDIRDPLNSGQTPAVNFTLKSLVDEVYGNFRDIQRCFSNKPGIARNSF